ncbi:MAG: hypothetical protein F6K45_02105 [Kamptonema sp. SIO1D9]|nr:hypothetical protein [Kamptonema sp. SIO1D9]
MKTDLTLKQRYTFASTVFNADFDNGAPINANQAWSLFFTLGQNDAILDANPELGRFFNNLLLGIIVTGMIGASIFTSI